VTRSDRYDPDINSDYADLATHDGTSSSRPGVRKPRDKAKVEVGVRHAYRMSLASTGARFCSQAAAARHKAQRRDEQINVAR
jgi:hypothetical protein